MIISSDGFNRVQTVRPHQAPLKYSKKWAPQHKIFFYFFIVAPDVDDISKRKKKLNQWMQHTELLHIMLLSLVFVTCEDFFLESTMISRPKLGNSETDSK